MYFLNILVAQRPLTKYSILLDIVQNTYFEKVAVV